MNILGLIIGVCLIAMLFSKPTKGYGRKFYTQKRRTKKEWWM